MHGQVSSVDTSHVMLSTASSKTLERSRIVVWMETPRHAKRLAGALQISARGNYGIVKSWLHVL